MDETIFTYKIGETTYVQQRPVYGTLRRVAAFFAALDSSAVLTAEDLYLHLGGKLPEFLAILLTPAGQHQADKDLSKIARELEWGMSGEQSLEVIRDFFSYDGLGQQILAVRLSAATLREMLATGTSPGASSSEKSTPPSACSQEETSPSEQLFCGHADRTIPSPISSTGSGK